jgi:hypothetical protein
MRKKYEHPSYGMVNITQVQSTGTVLFGSRIKHDSFIKLDIQTAVQEKDEYSEHFFPRKTIVSISLSAAQFANMLVRSNTSGVPCTIDYTKEDGYIEKPKDTKPLKVEFEQDTYESLQKLKGLTKKLSSILRNDFKGQIKKDKKEEIRTLAIQIESGINSNIDFLFQKQVEKLEQVGSEIISEAEARINSLVYDTGIKTLKKQNLIGNKNAKS